MGCYARVLSSLVVLWIWAANGSAAPCAPWVTQVVSIQGTVEVKRAKQNGWSRVQLNDQFCAGDSIRADIYSRAGLLLRNETLLRLDQGTTLVLPQLYDEDNAWLELVRGAVHFISNIPYRLKVKTPFVNAAIEGTEFAVRVAESDTKVWVLEGKVSVDNAQGKISLGPGEAAVVEAGKGPVPYLKIKPRDAVQWALYYPPIIDYRPSAAADSQRQSAVTFYRTGQIAKAIEALNAVPDTDRDGSFYSQRAALLLSVGQVQSAELDINKARVMSPENGAPLALQSVIALTQNNKEKALLLAQEAVKLEPKSPVPQVALSYAQQAAFNIDGATESIKKALELAPDDPLAWARLSELALSSGELDDALDAAKKAEALDPELSRTQMVLGFAQLMEIDIDEAQESFSKAIKFDPSAPLPRLGMGLAKIRQGDVEEGRKDIEVAAVLDPENSLIRSYLGKAYYEEKRGTVANREFTIAKQLDPKDPTPWFYDAIYKQTVNRPVEALHDMQKAIELNDNRAVYRSKLLLDDDFAARSASLGRIYNDLGFQQLGLVEGWKSVNVDPGNYSGHRLIADNYAALPRHEVARVSELLRSQLLQPVNITPVQPQLGSTNLLSLNSLGPANPSFNEFNPLFARNRFALQASGIVGTDDTYGDEITHSGLWNNFSYSVGQYHNETNGFRENNDLKRDIYNVFTQVAVTSNFSLQAEYRYEQTEQGDIELRFDPDNFDTSFRRKERSNTARVGMNYAPANHSKFIGSLIYQRGKENQTSDFFDFEEKTEGYISEGQYLFDSTLLDLTLGGGYYDIHSNDVFDDLTDGFASFPSEFDIQHANAYLYSYVHYPSVMTWTFGVSFDSLKDGLIGDFEQFNPKFGLIWNILPSTTIRLAAFRNLKRSLLNDQTIEPTQVASWNQMFDDPAGTDSWRFGIALNHKFSANFYGGLEASKRDLRVPIASFPNTIIEDWREELYRAYFYWTPSLNWAVSLQYELENFDRRESDSFAPDDTTTQFLPLEVSYFHSSGFFGLMRATYVNQRIRLFSGKEREEFIVVDAGLGYRLPKRYGIINVGVKNLFDSNFRFQELDEFRTRQGVVPRIQPGRNIAMQVTFSFQ